MRTESDFHVHCTRAKAKYQSKIISLQSYLDRCRNRMTQETSYDIRLASPTVPENPAAIATNHGTHAGTTGLYSEGGHAIKTA